MSRSVRVVWDDALCTYDFGPSHPLAPVRVELTMALARELGVVDRIEVVGCAPATDDELALVHKRDYIEAVRRVSGHGLPDLAVGLGTEDNPAFAGVHEASALIAGATLTAAKAVWNGEAEHAVNVSGGLHHAMPTKASGFCVYNDPAVAIAWMLAQGAKRIAYVDLDVHHGDGVQAMFYDDPRVLTISLHESPRTLFPGTGWPSETGAERPARVAVRGWAHEMAGGRWIATGGGGYEIVQVVPRTWTHLLAEAAGEPLDPMTATPLAWRELVRARTSENPPLTMTDGRVPEFRDISSGYDPADSVDRAVMATRNAVFPLHGLDPLP